MPASKRTGGMSPPRSQEQELSVGSKVHFMEPRKPANSASSSCRSLPDIIDRLPSNLQRSRSEPATAQEEEGGKNEGKLVPRRKRPAKSATLDETQFYARNPSALVPSSHTSSGVGASRGKSFSGPQTTTGRRRNSNVSSSLDMPRQCEAAAGLRPRASTGGVFTEGHMTTTGEFDALARLKVAEARLMEAEGLLADESSVLKDYVARCSELQAENAALKAELELAKDSTAMAEEEVFQVAKELKEVRVALASAKYETSVTRKMQDDMTKKLSEARADGRRIQAEADSLRDKIFKMEAFWGPLEAKTAECLRADVVAHIEETLQQYQTMPYRECATMVDVLRNKYLPENNTHLPSLHGWFFGPILEVHPPLASEARQYQR